MLSLEYVAGLFDGEGSVSVTTPGVKASTGEITDKQRRVPSFCISASMKLVHEPTIREFQQQFGGCYFRQTYVTPVNRESRVIYQWRTTNGPSYRFFTAILPFARIKRDQIEIAIELLEHMRTCKANRWTNTAAMAEMVRHRRTLTDRIRGLKKLEHHSLPVGDGPATIIVPDEQEYRNLLI